MAWAFIASMAMFSAYITIVGARNELYMRDQPEGYRLSHGAGFVVVASRQVRPSQVYRVAVAISRMYHSQLTVRAILSRDGDNYADQTTLFSSDGSTPTGDRNLGVGSHQIMELKVPDNVLPGCHKLTVEGLVDTFAAIGDAVFRNETEIELVTKYVSILIQTDKPIYSPPETVDIRVIGVIPGSLKPVFGSMTVYVLDAKRNVVRRWLQQQLNMGIYHTKFTLEYPLNTGTWAVAVDAFGHRYEQNFTVEFFYERRFEVNVTVPLQISNTEWGVAGLLYGEHLSGMRAKGNATIKLWVREQDGTQLDGELVRELPVIKQEVPFDFPMKEITEKFGDVTDKELHFKAWFFDWEWYETQNGTARTRVTRDGVTVKVIGRHLTSFKPGFSQTVYFSVESPDGTQYKGTYDRLVFIQTTYTGGDTVTPPLARVLIPEDNIIRHVITPGKHDKRISVRCWHSSGEHTTEEVNLYRYYSPKDNYVKISTSTEKPAVGSYMIFTVQSNVFVDEMTYLIMAKGSILMGNQLRMSSYQKTFTVAMSRDMAPFARILVYFTFDEEVVSDGFSFHVKDTRLTQAEIVVNPSKDFTGDTLELIGFGAPGAMMSTYSTDHEMFRRGMRNIIDEEKILEDMQEYEQAGQAPFQKIWHHDDERWDESVFLPAELGGLDTLQTFYMGGLVILSDMNFTGQSYEDQLACNSSLGLARCPDRGCYMVNETCDGHIRCTDGYDEMACPMEEREIARRREPDMEYLQRQVRYFNSHKWLWNTIYIMPVGRTEIQVEVPEAKDPYVISALALHPDEGLTIVAKDKYASHDTSRVFFMGLELPEAARRGEQLGVRCSLFNDQEERIEVIVMLHGSDDYRFVNVEEFGFVRAYSPRTTAGDIQTMVVLEAGEYRYLNIPVLPIIESGEVTIVVSAYTFYDSDIEEATVEIRYDGVENGDYAPYLIDLVNQGSVIIPDFGIPIPEKFVRPESRFHLYVPGSQACIMSLFGDVVAPGFYDDYLNTDSVTGLPHDSADGYMFDFAINLQMMKYLQQVNRLTPESAYKAMEYMKDTLMRQYSYMQDDGSFKMFRRNPKPCLMVTAFIARILHEAKRSEWTEELFIEISLINKVAQWIVDQQQKNGAFIETAHVIFDRSYEPYTTDKDGNVHEWHIPLTAYVTIALGSLTRVTGEAKANVDAARDRAAQYLASKWTQIEDPFQMAITAYALSMASHPDKDSALSRLRDMRRPQGDFTYWAHMEIEPNPVKIIDNIHVMEPRPDYTNLANAVMATSYALKMYMAKSQEPYKTESISIMKWLQTQRMGMTIWSGTQDTLLALEALTDFAFQETNRHFYQMEITLGSTFSHDYSETFRINSTNFDGLFQSEIPLAHGQVRTHAKGTGYAVVHMDAFHNVEYTWLQSNPDYESFQTEVINAACSGRNCSIMDVTLCAKYAIPEVSDHTGMTVLQYEVPTGFVVSRDTIEAMYQAGTPGLWRVRFRGGVLITFFDRINLTDVCFTTRLERWYAAANVSIQYMINAFEYLEAGIQNNTIYTAMTLHSQHICQVCGSFQCPYCPWYNDATFIQPSLLLLLMTSLLWTVISGLGWRRAWVLWNPS